MNLKQGYNQLLTSRDSPHALGIHADPHYTSLLVPIIQNYPFYFYLLSYYFTVKGLKHYSVARALT